MRTFPFGEGGQGVRTQRPIVALLAAYLGLQVLVPLRHYLYPGEVNWTEEGHRFAWHMKLRDKQAQLEFSVTDSATGEQWTIDPHDELAEWQVRKMGTRPDMILQYSHHLVDEFRRYGHARVQVRARALASLNGRRPQRLIDSTVDLARESRSLRPAPWIIPLEADAVPGEQWTLGSSGWAKP